MGQGGANRSPALSPDHSSGPESPEEGSTLPAFAAYRTGDAASCLGGVSSRLVRAGRGPLLPVTREGRAREMFPDTRRESRGPSGRVLSPWASQGPARGLSVAADTVGTWTQAPPAPDPESGSRGPAQHSHPTALPSSHRLGRAPPGARSTDCGLLRQVGLPGPGHQSQGLFRGTGVGAKGYGINGRRKSTTIRQRQEEPWVLQQRRNTRS